MKKIITSVLCVAGIGLTLLTSSAFAGVESLLSFGNTNIVAANTTNTFGGTLIQGNEFARDLSVTWGFTLSGSSSSTNYLVVDTANLSGTNSIFTNGFWQSAAFVTNLVANGTNPVVLNFTIPATGPAGGTALYRFSMITSNGSSLYMSNIVLAPNSKVGL